ncbi:MAG: MFS transporter [Oligoflexia bacterium]|nr:MFS transporter [Oligoflexia bacterium]
MLMTMGVFQLLFLEGAFSYAYDTWTGPTYLSGLAGEFGVGVGLLSLITVVPWIGAVGQFATLGAYHRSASVRRYVVGSAAFARVLWLIPLCLGWYWGLQSALGHEVFPAKKWFLVSAIVGLVSQLIGSASGAAWMAWIRELVAPRVRGRFFGVRQRYTMVAVIVVHFLGILWAGWRPGGYPAGYGILLGCACLSAALSTWLLAKVPDVQSIRAENEVAPSTRMIDLIREPFRDEMFRNLVLFNAAFQFSIQIAGPYFPYFFTKELGFSMGTVAFWLMLGNIGWFVAALFWGRRIDRVDGWRSAFLASATLISISPMFYVFTGAGSVRVFAPFEYFSNGMFSAGYLLVYMKLQLERSPQGKSAGPFAVASAAAALSSGIGNLAGAQLAIWLQPWGGFRALFLIATVLRLATVWGLGYLLLGKQYRVVREIGVIARRIVHGEV